MQEARERQTDSSYTDIQSATGKLLLSTLSSDLLKIFSSFYIFPFATSLSFKCIPLTNSKSSNIKIMKRTFIFLFTGFSILPFSFRLIFPSLLPPSKLFCLFFLSPLVSLQLRFASCLSPGHFPMPPQCKGPPIIPQTTAQKHKSPRSALAGSMSALPSPRLVAHPVIVRTDRPVLLILAGGLVPLLHDPGATSDCTLLFKDGLPILSLPGGARRSTKLRLSAQRSRKWKWKADILKHSVGRCCCGKCSLVECIIQQHKGISCKTCFCLFCQNKAFPLLKFMLVWRMDGA